MNIYYSGHTLEVFKPHIINEIHYINSILCAHAYTHAHTLILSKSTMLTTRPKQFNAVWLYEPKQSALHVPTWNGHS